MRPEFDARDGEIRAKRLSAFEKIEGHRCGDYIVFADGVTRRISHISFDGAPQTSAGGSWYLGSGWTDEEAYVNFSGSLYRSVPVETLTPTDEIRDGLVWFFHHGFPQAHSAVHTNIPFRVFRCSLPAPE
jgi:hypothetical protein